MTRVAVAVALGAVLGALGGLASGSSHRAVTTLSVGKGSSLLAAETVAAFARTKVVADNAGVHSGLHARAIHGTSLVELSYSASSSVRALQVVQQAATALGTLVPARFAGVQAQVVDPPHAAGGGRPYGRFVLAGASLGLLLAALSFLRLPPRRRAERVPGTGPRVPQRPWRSQKPVPGTVPAPAPDPAPAPPPPPATEPPEPEPAPAPDPLARYRALLAEHGAEFGGDQVAQWEAYLDAFSAQTVDGRIPPSLEGMLGDVFAPLLARARS